MLKKNDKINGVGLIFYAYCCSYFYKNNSFTDNKNCLFRRKPICSFQSTQSARNLRKIKSAKVKNCKKVKNTFEKKYGNYYT